MGDEGDARARGEPAELVVEVAARNAVEAVAQAVERAGYPPHQVAPRRVEVVCPGRRWWRWWIRPMVLRVTLRVEPPAGAREAIQTSPPRASRASRAVSTSQIAARPAAAPTLARVRYGRVEILPGSPDEPAIIVPGPGTWLRVNGELAEGAVAVTAADHLEAGVAEMPPSDDHQGGDGSGTAPEQAALEAAAEPPGEDAVAPYPRILVSPDGLRAEVIAPPVRVRVLKDQGPARVLRLEAAILQRPPAGLTVASLTAALARAGVTEGIDQDVLARIAAEGAPVPVVVARGVPPQNGRDGRFVPRLEAPLPPKREARGRRRTVVSVSEGSLVGYVIPPEPGRPGRSVDGRKLPAKDGQPARVTCGPGVARIAAQGGREEFRALRRGRPVIQRVGRRTWYVDVVPVLVHDGDLTAATGSLRFDGDVIVTGSVTEGASVVAGGHIHVYGDVDHGLLEAAGDVTVDGAVIQARVVAGARARLYGRLRECLAPLAEGCQRILAAMRLVEGVASFQNRDITRFGPGRLVRLLLEMKFRDVRDQARAVHRQLAEHHGPVDPPVEALRKPLAELAGAVGDGFDLPGLLAVLAEAARFLEGFDTPAPATATAVYVHNGVLEATGAVRVGARGAYHARLAAGGRVSVQGAVVGGTVEAGRAVHVLEAGSPALPTTLLAVGEGGVIRVGYAHENVWLRVGYRQRRLAKPQANLQVGRATRQTAPVDAADGRRTAAATADSSPPDGPS